MRNMRAQTGEAPNSDSRWCVSDPLARFARVSPSRGGDYFILPLVRGRAAEGGRGSLTHHLESEILSSS